MSQGVALILELGRHGGAIQYWNEDTDNCIEKNESKDVYEHDDRTLDNAILR